MGERLGWGRAERRGAERGCAGTRVEVNPDRGLHLAIYETREGGRDASVETKQHDQLDMGRERPDDRL